MKKIGYILLVLVFFNISIVTLYYLQIIKHYSLEIFNNKFDILLTNVILFVILFVYSFIYQKFLLKKFNYFKIVLLGLLVGGVCCLFIFNFIIEEYLFIVTFISFSFCFISYSIYFETIKKEVFK